MKFDFLRNKNLKDKGQKTSACVLVATHITKEAYDYMVLYSLAYQVSLSNIIRRALLKWEWNGKVSETDLLSKIAIKANLYWQDVKNGLPHPDFIDRAFDAFLVELQEDLASKNLRYADINYIKKKKKK